MPEHPSGAMRPRMASVEELDDEIKTFSGQLEGVRQGMSVAEQRFVSFLNSYEDRVRRIEAMASRAESLAEKTSVTSQEAVNRVNAQLQTNVSMLMDITKTVREIQESKTKVWRDFAAAITPILVIVIGLLHILLGETGTK